MEQIAGVFVVLALLAIFFVAKQTPYFIFRSEFGVWPGNQKEEARIIKQAQVEKWLSVLAASCDAQRKLQQKILEKYRCSTLEKMTPISDLATYEEMGKDLSRLTDKFWRFYNVAKHYHFFLQKVNCPYYPARATS